MEIDTEIVKIIDTIVDFHEQNLEGRIDEMIELIHESRKDEIKVLDEVSSDLYWIGNSLGKVVGKLKQLIE